MSITEISMENTTGHPRQRRLPPAGQNETSPQTTGRRVTASRRGSLSGQRLEGHGPPAARKPPQVGR